MDSKVGNSCCYNENLSFSSLFVFCQVSQPNILYFPAIVVTLCFILGTSFNGIIFNYFLLTKAPAKRLSWKYSLKIEEKETLDLEKRKLLWQQYNLKKIINCSQISKVLTYLWNYPLEFSFLEILRLSFKMIRNDSPNTFFHLLVPLTFIIKNPF